MGITPRISNVGGKGWQERSDGEGEVELILCGWHICRAEFARITKTSVGR